jgi:uridine kinase
MPSSLDESLPRTQDGALVVAALVEQRVVSLSHATPATPFEAVTTASAEGREILRRSAGLTVLEAARRIGLAHVRIGPSLRSGRIVTLDPPGQREELTRRLPELESAVAKLIADDEPFVSEAVPIDVALDHFRAAGWRDACAYLEMGRDELSVELLRLGETRALRMGPSLPSTGRLAGIRLDLHPSGLLLGFGPFVRRELEPRAIATIALESQSPRYGSTMTRQQRSWLEPLGVTSVGDFGRACAGGAFRELIRVSEGFHEKNIAQIADRVHEDGARIVAIAGPSSSGKTTFIRRLAVQLEVVGLHPSLVSLDDYYVDRDKTVRDEQGELDFEAVEALDLDLLTRDLAALSAGQTVRPPRYDFLAGKSLPESQPALRLGPRDVLLVEGIHALNPRTWAAVDLERTLRIFVHPAGSLPFDHLSTLEPADVRLLRRIVRDRHGRGYMAGDTLGRWASVRRGERRHIEPCIAHADCIFDTSLVYETSVLKIFAERYLLEVPRGHPQRAAANRLRSIIVPFIPIEPEQVPATSILREFIGGSAFAE